MASDENKRQLIITADDCGLSEGINEAAYELHCRGILTTATVMMNFDAAGHALQLFQGTPSLRLGVHLNLTDGFPLTNIANHSGLVQSDGRFQPRTMLYSRAVFPTQSWLQDTRLEMDAQVQAFMNHTGHAPAHLTTHMHFHILPSLRSLVFDLAQAYDIPWVRAFETTSTLIPYNFLVQQPTELFQPDNLKITPDYIASIQAWLNLDPEQLIDTMLGLNGLFELVVHPDNANDQTYPVDMSHRPQARAREMEYLLQLADAMRPHQQNFLIADPSTPPED